MLLHLQDVKDIAVLLVKYGWLTFSTRLVITHLSLFVFGSQVRCLLLKLDLLNEVVSDWSDWNPMLSFALMERDYLLVKFCASVWVTDKCSLLPLTFDPALKAHCATAFKKTLTWENDKCTCKLYKHYQHIFDPKLMLTTQKYKQYWSVYIFKEHLIRMETAELCSYNQSKSI